ncbi:MAG: hypothetical protein ACLURS_03540 [Bacteroides fragilis]
MKDKGSREAPFFLLKIPHRNTYRQANIFKVFGFSEGGESKRQIAQPSSGLHLCCTPEDMHSDRSCVWSVFIQKNGMRVSSNRYAAKTRFFCICFTLFICPANIGFYAVVYNTYM